MGAYLDNIYYRKEGAGQVSPASTLDATTIQVQKDTAALDKILENPKASTKQIVSAMNKLNASTDRQLEALMDSLNKPQTVTATNNEPTNTSSGGPLAPALEPEPITPAAIPTALSPAVSQPAPPPVKTAPIDTVLFDDDSIDSETMFDLLLESIGGHELINVARNDIINGQQVSYQPIKNLSLIQQQYNPNNIVSLQSTSDKYFAKFAIKLENKVPNPGTGPDGAHVYLDNNTGNMIVEAINLEVDEQIEVEITTSGTIYEAEFGESNS